MYARPSTLWILLPVLIGLSSCSARREGDNAEECRDGADNDRDGAFDCQDDGCANSPDCAPAAEGDDALECRDGADNDTNGLYDCQDPGCASSPDCDGSPPRDTEEPADDSAATDDSSTTDDSSATDDSSTTDDTSPVSGSCADVGAPTGSGTASIFKRADISFTMDIMPVDGSLAEDCTLTLKGTAEQFKVSTKRVEMCGTWALDSTNCVDEAVRAAKKAVWWDDNGEGYHTFTFKDDTVKALNIWVAHKTQGDFSYGNTDKIYFFDLNAALDADNKVHHSEGSSITDDTGFYYGEVLFTLDVQFYLD